RLGALIHRANQQPRIFEQIPDERPGRPISRGSWSFDLDILVGRRNLADLSLRILDPVIGAECRSQLRIARNCITQFLFARLKRRPDLWIEEPCEITVAGFPVVWVR